MNCSMKRRPSREWMLSRVGGGLQYRRRPSQLLPHLGGLRRRRQIHWQATNPYLRPRKPRLGDHICYYSDFRKVHAHWPRVGHHHQPRKNHPPNRRSSAEQNLGQTRFAESVSVSLITSGGFHSQPIHQRFARLPEFYRARSPSRVGSNHGQQTAFCRRSG
jgi:hypothetical protein